MKGPPFRSRRAFALVDQAMSSATNFVPAVLVAQSVSARTFGVFAIAAGIYWFVISGIRSLVGEPLIVMRAELVLRDRDTDRQAVAFGVLLGVASGVILVPFLASPATQGIGLLGIVLPAFVWQDVNRYVFFARGEPQYAAALDGAWLVVELVLAAAVIVTHAGSLAIWIAVWGLSALVSVLVVPAARRLLPSWHGVADFLGGIRRIASQMFGDYLFAIGGQQVTLFALPLFASLSLLGNLKAVQVATGPLNVVTSAMTVVALPSIARLGRDGLVASALRRGVILSTVSFGLSALFVMFALVTPPTWGHAVFHASWPSSMTLLAFVGLQTGFTGVTQGARTFLRGTKNAKSAFVVRIWTTPLVVAFPLAGAWLGAERGLGIGLFLSSLVAAGAWWIAAVRASRGSGRRAGRLPAVAVVSE